MQSAASWKISSSSLVFLPTVLRGAQHYVTFVSSIPFPGQTMWDSPPSCPQHLTVFKEVLWQIFTMIFQTLFECMDFTGWLLFTFVVLLLTDVFRNWRPHNFPPGPWTVPFLGNVFTGVDFKTMEKVRQTIMFSYHIIFHAALDKQTLNWAEWLNASQKCFQI